MLWDTGRFGRMPATVQSSPWNKRKRLGMSSVDREPDEVTAMRCFVLCKCVKSRW